MEIWKDIEGYEGLYQISNMGNVKSLNYNRTGKEKILKSGKNKDNYLRVCLYKNGKQKKCLVHRLVAEVFIPRIEGKEFVDHINGIRDDNRIDNLRWCTHQENDNFPLSIKHRSEAQKGEKHPMFGKTGELNPTSKVVLCIELNKVFGSAHEAARELNLGYSHICAVCRGDRRTCGGYHWKYV